MSVKSWQRECWLLRTIFLIQRWRIYIVLNDDSWTLTIVSIIVDYRVICYLIVECIVVFLSLITDRRVSIVIEIWEMGWLITNNRWNRDKKNPFNKFYYYRGLAVFSYPVGEHRCVIKNKCNSKRNSKIQWVLGS